MTATAASWGANASGRRECIRPWPASSSRARAWRRQWPARSMKRRTSSSTASLIIPRSPGRSRPRSCWASTRRRAALRSASTRASLRMRAGTTAPSSCRTRTTTISACRAATRSRGGSSRIGSGAEAPLSPPIAGGDREVEILSAVDRRERGDADEIAALVEEAATRGAWRERGRSLHQIAGGLAANAGYQPFAERELKRERCADGEDTLADGEAVERAHPADRRQHGVGFDDATIGVVVGGDELGLRTPALMNEFDQRTIHYDMAIGEKQVLGHGDGRTLHDVAIVRVGHRTTRQDDKDGALHPFEQLCRRERLLADMVGTAGQRSPRQQQLDCRDPRRLRLVRIVLRKNLTEAWRQLILDRLLAGRRRCGHRLAQAVVVGRDAFAGEIAAGARNGATARRRQPRPIGRGMIMQRRDLLCDAAVERADALLQRSRAHIIDNRVLFIGKLRPVDAVGSPCRIAQRQQSHDRQHFMHRRDFLESVALAKPCTLADRGCGNVKPALG